MALDLATPGHRRTLPGVVRVGLFAVAFPAGYVAVIGTLWFLLWTLSAYDPECNGGDGDLLTIGFTLALSGVVGAIWSASGLLAYTSLRGRRPSATWWLAGPALLLLMFVAYGFLHEPPAPSSNGVCRYS